MCDTELVCDEEALAEKEGVSEALTEGVRQLLAVLERETVTEGEALTEGELEARGEADAEVHTVRRGVAECVEEIEAVGVTLGDRPSAPTIGVMGSGQIEQLLGRGTRAEVVRMQTESLGDKLPVFQIATAPNANAIVVEEIHLARFGQDGRAVGAGQIIPAVRPLADARIAQGMVQQGPDLLPVGRQPRFEPRPPDIC